jgi:hypothetical protein
MKGHGSKLNRKMEQAVVALLTARNHEEAARSLGVSLKTLQRWQKLPEFERAFREARLKTFRQALVPISRDPDRTWQNFQQAGGAESAGMM